jgi:hypothetical protein
MSLLSQEVRATQNTALGATVIWRFACGYNAAHPQRGFPPLQLCFLSVPILYHKPLLELLDGTQRASGLRQFVLKLSDTKLAHQDLLFAIQDRAEKWKDVSLESLRLAMACRLVKLEIDGRVVRLTDTEPSGLSAPAKKILRNAEKLGSWMSQLSLHEVSNLLHVRF